ncbi:hypothetical protein Pelo_18029 [Pelomyxa schiedti]|nr:hypothetical protein Pelo_18029 [Pelomyxa schiedti]
MWNTRDDRDELIATLEAERDKLRSELDTKETEEKKSAARVESAALRAAMRRLWLGGGRTAEEFADEFMDKVASGAIPERARRAKFREWLEGDKQHKGAWDNEIEKVVAEWLAARGEDASAGAGEEEEDDAAAVDGERRPSAVMKAEQQREKQQSYAEEQARAEAAAVSEGFENQDIYEDAEAWGQVIKPSTPACDENKEQKHLTKRQQRKSIWLRREFEARWLVEKSLEDFAAEFMGDISGLPARSRAPRLREWLLGEGMGTCKQGPVCAWVPEIERAVLSWLMEKGGVVEEPDWDEKLPAESPSTKPIVTGVWASVWPEAKDIEETKPQREMAEALRNTTATLILRNKEIAQLQSELSEALCNVNEKQTVEENEKAKQASGSLRAFVAAWPGGVDEVADIVMSEVAGGSFPERSRRTRFRNWVQSGSCCGWEGQIEAAVRHWAEQNGVNTETLTNQLCESTGTPSQPFVINVIQQESSVAALEAENAALEAENAALKQRLAALEHSRSPIIVSDSDVADDLEKTRAELAELIAQREKHVASVQSKQVKAAFEQHWLAQHTVEEFVISQMGDNCGELADLPARSRVARFRQWLEGSPCGGWGERIERRVAQWLSQEGFCTDDTEVVPTPQVQFVVPVAAQTNNDDKLVVESLMRQVQDLKKQLGDATNLLHVAQEENQELSKQLEQKMMEEEQKEAKEQKVAHDQHSSALRAIVSDKWLSQRSLEEFVTEHMQDAAIPQRSKVARFRQWLEGKHVNGCEAVIESCVEQWVKNEDMEIRGDEPEREVPTKVVYVPIEKVVYTQPVSPLAALEATEIAEMKQELLTLRSVVSEVEDKKDKKHKATRSAKLRCLVRDIWLPKFTQEEFADEIMSCVPAIPERSRRARLREWLEGKPSMWENEIEATVQKFFEVKGLYKPEEEGEKVEIVEQQPSLVPEFVYRPPDKYEEEDWREKCELLSNANKELVSHLAYIEGDQQTLQKDMEDLKFRYFQALGRTFKLQGMHLSCVLDDLYETAKNAGHDYDDYEAFLGSLLSS